LGRSRVDWCKLLSCTIRVTNTSIFISKKYLGGLFLLGMPLVAAAQTQPSAPPEQAKLSACVQEFSGDSVALFYDVRYTLTPMACATLRRQTHLDDKGNFNGETRDYQRATNHLLFRQQYDHGVRQGVYEAYYPNGQAQMRGTFTKGEPSGEWQFWYANGKPWQTLRWDATGPQPWRFVAYWDSTGQQLLANGRGRWQEINPRLHRRIEGQVVNELPDGEWQVYHLDGQQLLTTETYALGTFKKGHNWVGLGPVNYRDKPRIVPTFEDQSAEAERYRLGYTCAELARRAVADQALTQRLASISKATAHVKDISAAKPDGDGSTYLRLLLQQLSATASMKTLLLNPEYSAEVEADIDELGKLGNFQSKVADIQRVFTQVVPRLGRWNAAKVNGIPTGSHVRFTLAVVDQQWHITYRVGSIDLAKVALP
jgi:hypothetical protein